MQIKYYTTKGSIYIQTLEQDKDYWIKEDSEGQIHALAAGLHISIQSLQELIREYPSTLLDKTYLFGDGVEEEFFADAQREHVDGLMDEEETVILFLVKHSSGRYQLGCRSQVVKTEKVE
jgi:hypothetical protein